MRIEIRGYLKQIALAGSLAAIGCAGPVEGLWPPDHGAPARTVVVSLDTWHAMIALPRRNTDDSGPRTAVQPSDSSHDSSAPTSQSSARFRLASAGRQPPRGFGWPPKPGEGGRSQEEAALSPQSWLYEEWGYAEQGWYLEARQGISGVVRALFWPSTGVVEVGRHKQVWSQRTPQPPAETFTFHLTEEGYKRLRHYLESSRTAAEMVLASGRSRFYPATRSYHVFHHCHHYSAQALREAGLPVSSFWALTRGMFAAQLRRAEQMAAELD